ncbi:MAG TPA: hypothetical protein VEH27_00655 [Methylomirabilota bacterium]|nr:hypothetical protein [Methylomirabilota bacterium]
METETTEKPKGRRTIRHLAQSIEGALRLKDRDLEGWFKKDDGSWATPAEARAWLEENKALGRRVLPYEGCDNFDYQTGCKGHEEPEPGIGPFTAKPFMADENEEWKRWAILDAGGHGVATVDPVGATPAEVEARARLFAAAPEMLEELKKALDVVMECDPDTVRVNAPSIRAAIAKAEGRQE